MGKTNYPFKKPQQPDRGRSGRTIKTSSQWDRTAGENRQKPEQKIRLIRVPKAVLKDFTCIKIRSLSGKFIS